MESKPTVEAHILCFNESDIIHFIVKHYQKFCNRIIIYDNYSEDNSVEIAMSLGCEIRYFGEKGRLDDMDFLSIKNNAWKGSPADFVIVCDMDEVLYHENLTEVLRFANENNETIFKTQGYNMYSNRFPKSDILELEYGIDYFPESKSAIFSPKLKEINYQAGAHKANPKGNIKYSETELKLLHYKFIGGIDRCYSKYKKNASRLSKDNLRMGLSTHYLQSFKEVSEHIRNGIIGSIKVI